MKKKRLTALLISVVLALGSFGCASAGDAADNNAQTEDMQDEAQKEIIETGESGFLEYSEYLLTNNFKEDGRADREIRIPAAGVTAEDASGEYITAYQGRDNCLYWDEQGSSMTWEFDVEQEGFYNLALDYCGISWKNYDIVMDILLDGEVPFENAQNVNFHRLFLDETYFGMTEHAFHTDVKGNEMRPTLMEQLEWQTQLAYDPKDEYAAPLYFYLSQGKHSLTLTLKEEAVAISEIIFLNAPEAGSYEEVLAGWEAQGAADSSGYYGEYEAEAGYLKNDITLFATYDTANWHVSPSSSTSVLYNTIGKNTWKDAGQQITWEFEVPQDGYYNLSFKAKQYDKNNAYSVRKITIDGEMLYQEMETVRFPYSSKWYIKTLENREGEALRVYLSAGRHVLGMTAAVDEELSELLRGVKDVTKELQYWYREIIKVTGFNADSESDKRVSVDQNRDFQLEKNVPGLLEGLEACKEQLEYYYEMIGQMEDISTSSASVLKETSVLLGQLVKKPGKIAKRLDTLRDNISNVSSWAIEMQIQPLTLDKFMVYSPDVETPKVESNGWNQLCYRFGMFVHSFAEETNTISGTGEAGQGNKTLQVWISTADLTTTGASSGRDQAILLKKMIDESFTPGSGINVDVSLVNSSGTLTQAVLAGEGPDVALFTSVDTPVNLAMRGALLDLSQFEDFGEVTKQFTESAIVPFRYKDGCYAFPETQNFNVLFYRTDIYEELGLEPPTTWDEFYAQIVLLYNHNYMVGVPQQQNVFETFLYQMGESFYSDGLTRSSFHTNTALQAFDSWTGLYNKYSLSLVYDFFNRFRSGEMALAIEPYNMVNYLYSAAPELDGLWDIAMMPGTVQADGSVNYVETSTSTGAIALADTEYPEEAYEFLKWWVSAEVQGQFGVQLEQSLGVAARYGTANLEAFEELPWSTGQADVIRRQRENTVAVEQIPGSYYIARNLTFAFRGVVLDQENLRETMYKYNIEINKELKRKQKEFNY